MDDPMMTITFVLQLLLSPRMTCYLADMVGPVVVVHGGAWAVPDCLEAASRQGVRQAAREAYRVR